ncbi:MAG TPA: GspH/FimT family protein [Trueperaceae bacterium]|nr:GspH/FimT family protein [Trueperaceae bacterium]
MRQRNGFTLVEMVIVLAVVGILLAIGLVSFHPDHVAVNQAARGFADQLSRARIEALKNDAYAFVTLDTSGDGSYAVCVDQNGNAQCDAGEAVQTVSLGQGNNSQVRLASAAFSQFEFDPRGIPLTSPAGAVVFSNANDSYSVTVQVSTAGKATVQ